VGLRALTVTRVFAGFVLVASALVLGGALLSQYWGGLSPCELCLLQRWPWRVAIAVALIALLAGPRIPLRWVALIVAAIFAVSIAFAFYHVGVEQHWFAGPSACTAHSGAMTLDELKQQIRRTQAVMCDQVQWSLFGVSLAGWNLVASLAMTAICVGVFAKTRPSRSRSTTEAAA
jgi:disulfide bond formation protein DsbB